MPKTSGAQQPFGPAGVGRDLAGRAAAEAGGVFRWWLTMLRQSAPTWLRRNQTKNPTVLVVHMAQDTVSQVQWLGSSDNANQRRDHAAPGKSEETLRVLIGRLRKALQDNPDIRLAICLNDGFNAQAVYPMAALSDLNSLIALDLDRLFPLPAEALDFAWTVTGWSTGAGSDGDRIHVCIDAAPMTALTAAHHLAQNLGRHPDYVGCAAGPPWQNPLRRPRRTTGAMPAQIKYAGLAFFTAANLIYPAAALHSSADQAARTATALRSEAEALAAQRDALRDHYAAHGALMGGTPDLFSILTMLSAAMPEEAQLRRLVLREGALDLSGEAGQAAQLVDRLTGQGPFGPITYLTPVSVETDNQTERFNLRVSLTDQQGERP